MTTLPFQKIVSDSKVGMYTALVGDDNFYTQYDVQVVAFNEVGNGPPSPVVTIWSAEDSKYEGLLLTIFRSNSKFNKNLECSSLKLVNWSQRNFVHVTTVYLSWRVQNFIMISRVYFKPAHCIFLLNFKFSQNIISGAGTRASSCYSHIIV